MQLIGSFVHSHVHSFPSTFCSLLFKQAHLWHMEVPGPGVKSELQLPAYATATATPDLNHIWELYHSSWQHQIFNPPEGGARDQKHILTETTSGPEPSEPQQEHFFPLLRTYLQEELCQMMGFHVVSKCNLHPFPRNSFLKFFFLFLFLFEWICTVVPISAVQQSDPVLHIPQNLRS